MKNYKFSIIFVTLYLLLFMVAGRLGAGLPWMFFMFSLSPFLLLWMVYTILKYGKYSGKKLSQGEEWGYEDRSKDKLNTF